MMRPIKFAEGTYTNVAILGAVIVVLGVVMIIMGMRKRNTLDVPLISNHTKTFSGGTLLIVGLCLLAFAWLKSSM
ncbi:MAG TPA: hypothetical protein VFB45_01060 [Pseudolabrys sp.]|nr:hypothetical protein [Pseudolabrys sp.]